MNVQAAAEQKRVLALTVATRRTSQRSQSAAVILLLGLIIEIIGALFLAGPALIAKQVDIFSLRAGPPLTDLAMRDVHAEPRMHFLGSLGALCLLIGFVLQYVGTLVAISVGPALLATLVAIASGISVWTLVFLLGQTWDQPRLEKLSKLATNTRRVLLPLWWTADRCDHCGESFHRDGVVWWLQEANTPPHQYLHAPYRWHAGHPQCLTASCWYLDPHGNLSRHLKQSDVRGFVAEEAPRVTAWWLASNKHWDAVRGKHQGRFEEQEFCDFHNRMKRVIVEE
jgi:hypothetical protein